MDASASPCSEGYLTGEDGEKNPYLSSDTKDFETFAAGAECRRYYRKKAQIQLQPERRLGNGIAWRLLVDAHTGMAMPRIVWMPHDGRRFLANGMFEAIHGARIADGYAVEDYVREERRLQEERKRGFEDRTERQNDGRREAASEYVGIADYFAQTDVALTYASRRFIGYREFGSASQNGHRMPFFFDRDSVFDLERGVAFGIGSCPGMGLRYGKYLPSASFQPSPPGEAEKAGYTYRYFAFGDLLNICDDARYQSFRALVVASAKSSLRTEDWTDPKSDGAAIPWTLQVIRAESPTLPVLTLSGMALYPFSPRNVGFLGKEIYGDPIVIPYRALASLMTAGPLRDELLSLP